MHSEERLHISAAEVWGDVNLSERFSVLDGGATLFCCREAKTRIRVFEAARPLNKVKTQTQFHLCRPMPQHFWRMAANFLHGVIPQSFPHTSVDLLEQVENRFQLICSVCHILCRKSGHNKLICMGVSTPRHLWNMIWFASKHKRRGRIHRRPRLRRFVPPQRRTRRHKRHLPEQHFLLPNSETVGGCRRKKHAQPKNRRHVSGFSGKA